MIVLCTQHHANPNDILYRAMDILINHYGEYRNDVHTTFHSVEHSPVQRVYSTSNWEITIPYVDPFQWPKYPYIQIDVDDDKLQTILAFLV